jgi:hypothetical protein
VRLTTEVSQLWEKYRVTGEAFQIRKITEQIQFGRKWNGFLLFGVIGKTE